MRERKVRSLAQIYETAVQILNPKVSLDVYPYRLPVICSSISINTDSSAVTNNHNREPTHAKLCKRGELKERHVYPKSSFQKRKSESILLEEQSPLMKIPKSCFFQCPNGHTCNYMQKASCDTSHILSICSSHDPLYENADSKSVVEAVRSSGNVATHHAQLIPRTFNHEKKESYCIDDDRSCISRGDGQNLSSNDKKTISNCKKVKVCDICGDIGMESSLATCSRCNDGAEHIYCMRIMTDRLPEGNWLCEDCVLHDKNEKWKEINMLKNASSASTQLSAVQIPTQSLGATTREKGPSLKVIDGLVIHPVKNVSFQTECSTINLHRGEAQIDFFVSASGNTSSMYSSFYPGIVSNAEGTCSSRIAASIPYKWSNSFDAQSCGMNEESHVVHNNESMRQLSVGTACASGRDFQEDLQTRGHPMFSACMPVPEMQYIWKGGFHVLVNQKLPRIFDQIQAHLSASASHKVTELVNKFPNIIALEEVSISSVWSDKLLGDHAMEDNIALYFFSQSYDSYTRNYQQFLECMIKYDLALKACFDGTDLFIFSSSLLPEKSNCWNCLYFLWGLFREGVTNSPEQASVQAINHGFNDAHLHRNGFPLRITDESLPSEFLYVNKESIFNSCGTGVCTCDASSDRDDVIYQSKTSSPVHDFFATEEKIHDPRFYNGACHFNAGSTFVSSALCIDIEAQRWTSLEWPSFMEKIFSSMDSCRTTLGISTKGWEVKYNENEQYKLINKEDDDEHPSLDLSLSLG